MKESAASGSQPMYFEAFLGGFILLPVEDLVHLLAGENPHDVIAGFYVRDSFHEFVLGQPGESG